MVATGVLVGVAATSGGQKQVAVPANSVAAIDPDGSVTTILPVGERPVAAVAAADSLWVANLDDHTVTRIDLSSRRILASIPIGGAPTALAATPGAVWVSDTTGEISRIDPEYNRPVPTRQLAAVSSLPHGTAWPMLAASGSIWIVDPDGYVGQFDPGSGQRIDSVDVGNEPSAVAAGAGWLWVTNSADGTVTRIDPATLVATPIPVGHGPDAVAVNAAGVWVANAGDDALVRINPDTGAVAATASVGDGPAAVLATATALWVANARDDTVMRLDPRSGAVTKTIHLGGSPTALVSAAGQVWVTVAPAPAPPPVTGGTAHFTLQDDFASLDPALAHDPSTVEVLDDDLRQPGDVPGQAGACRIADRPGGRRGGPDPHRRRQDLQLHDPARLPLLAALERGGHRADIQGDHRARGQPAAEFAVRERSSAASSATTVTSRERRQGSAGWSRAAIRSRSRCRSRTVRSSPTSRAVRPAPSRAARQPSRAAWTTSRRQARTTSPRTHHTSS